MSDEIASGPHVTAAFLCEKVLQEKDGVLSFIRLVDRFIRPRPTGQIPPQPIQVMLVAGLKGGGIPAGNYKVKFRCFKPNASSPFVEIEQDAFFEGTLDHGVTIGTQFLMLADEDGPYRIEVHFEGRVLTQVLFRVIFAGVPTMQPPPQPGA